MEIRLEIFTLGGVRILQTGDEIVGLTTRKAEALLIYLASTRRPHPREVLADLLWDERTQSQSMGNLRVVLTNLRQQLGEYLTITRGSVGVNSSAQLWMDSVELEGCLEGVRKSGGVNASTALQASKALELYRGDFLAGFSVYDCRGFEDWAVRERERLHQLAVDGLSALAQDAIERQDYQAGMAYATRLLELDPLMEKAHRQMMALLAQSGQRAAAMSQYETCRKLLQKELKVEPAAETRQLYEQIRAGQSGARAKPVQLPGGTVSFLFTEFDVLNQRVDNLRESIVVARREQRKLLHATFQKWRGHLIEAQEDSFLVAFGRATDAISSAVEAQQGLARHARPEYVSVRVRMGLHTGEPWTSEEGYGGIDVNQAARIAHVAHGGQVLLSETTTALVKNELPSGVSLRDLGRHLLKDLHRPERICQLVMDGLPAEFPPLTTLETLPPEGTRIPRQVGACPYRGLAAFREADAAFYFGRERFIDALEHAVRTKKLVAVIVGSSGSGKSSALFAGLLPRLRRTGGSLFAIFRPGSQPFDSLAGTLLPLLEPGLSETDRLVETRKLAEVLTKSEVSLAQVAWRIVKKNPQASQIQLLIDQFEELYTLCPDVRLQEAFIDELLATVEAAKAQLDGSAAILLTLRADFMGQALAHRPFADALQEASLLMGPMTRLELHQAIEKPAEMQGAAFEAGLVERILDDVGEKPGNLPLLEFTLTQLWEGQTDGWLTHADYEAMGCVEGALAAYADQVYADLDPTEQERARQALVQLVQPGEGTEDTRRIATHEELGDETWSLIQRLADKRLVVTGSDAQGRETAEVVHEALIQKWGRFQEWMDTDRAFREWQERLRNSLRQWRESGQDEGALLAGAPLAIAQNWLADRGEGLSAAEVQYIQASEALQIRQERERQRRRQWTFAGLTAGLLIAIALVMLVYFQRQNALHQAAILLAGQAESELANGYHDRAVLLALAALEDYPYTTEAERALGKAVSYSQALQLYEGHASAVTSLDWSPDGKRIASTGTDNTVRIWDAASGETTGVIELPKGITGNIYDMGLTVKWTPGGQRLVTLSGDRFLLGSQDYDLLLWDANTGELLNSVQLPNQAEPEMGKDSPTTLAIHFPTGAALDFAQKSGRLATIGGDNTAVIWDAALQRQVLTLEGHANDVNGIDWSPQENQLATASEDGTARIWDAQTGKELKTLEGHSGAVNVATWSPDGTQLATGGDDGIVLIWDTQTGERKITIEPQGGIVYSLAWSPDGKKLVIGTGDKQVRIWDMVTNQLNIQLSGHNDFVSYVAWSPDGQRFASGANDGTVRVWKAYLGAVDTAQYPSVSTQDWSSDSRYLALPIGEPPALLILEVTTGLTRAPEMEFNDHMSWQVEYSPNNRFILLRVGIFPLDLPAEFSNPHPLYVVDTTTGKTVLEISSSDGMFIRDARWSPDGKRIATGSIGGAIDIWDFPSGKQLGSMLYEQKAFVGDLDWSPDGTKLVTGGMEPVARIWDVASGRELLTLVGIEPPAGAWSVNWSPDGKYILTTSGTDDQGAKDTTVRIWEADSGKNILVIEGHNQQVTSGDWSPNMARIVTSSADDSVRMWDVKSGAELLNLSAPTNYYSEAMWSPDGRYIAVAMDQYPGIMVFRAWQSTQELLDYAKECCVFRQLTDLERHQFGLAGLN
jgi:WD40 repeat protein/DNA-binding SARP family transcriptional activator